MSADAAALGVWLLAYLCGSVPVGYLAGRLRGVDLFAHGSRNVGATNAARVLGKRVGAAVFVLDFLKGSAPVALAVPLAGALGGTACPVDWLRVGAAAAAFLGHLYPVTLGFRGGKGVATGAGVTAVLLPGPFAAALVTWAVVALGTRTVSVASVACALALAGAQLLAGPDPFGAGLARTVFVLAGVVVVIIKHRPNLARVWAGTESQFRDTPVRQQLLASVHVLAAGLWFGGAAFFSFAAAPAIFGAFPAVVASSPSDRTGNVNIVPPGATDDDRKALASALAGSAVAPVFPRFFAVQAACGVVALVTALAWRQDGTRGRARVGVFAVALALVAAGWPLSNHVSALRAERFSPDQPTATAAREAFGPWHLVSLAASGVTTLLAGAGLALAARGGNNGGLGTGAGEPRA